MSEKPAGKSEEAAGKTADQSISSELTDKSLEQVSGGAGSSDKTHPKLTETSSAGKHLEKVTI